MADQRDTTPRPRPRPASTAPTSSDGPATVGSTPSRRPPRRRARPAAALARIEPAQPGQVIAAAGNALVTAGRMGRLLGRSGWRIARQLPVVAAVESGAQRAGTLAASEFTRLLQLSQPGGTPVEEHRVMTLVKDAQTDPAPLRTAMSELLDRSALSDDRQSREYLFGTIVSQLVPDEARMLAALATGRTFAVVDVLAREGGRSGRTRPVLTNVSTLGAAAGVAVPASTPTYLSRLESLGLVEFVSSSDALSSQYESLRSDPSVRAARDEADRGKTSAKVARKAVRLAPLGREFWTACAPAAPPSGRRSG
ncbi:Abi-alpha family protein [Jatrophihabitans endophyticus]|uniref:Abi-alpha family protein n=1 Tax=Jatrophihabitans endophyticus TaxID=1206085 RepID=UPI0019E18122|nr:Abi-alpha family protein [Jatrophihabitans endophyticus]MBE7186794.1 DUF4393 domain-containing protein [Jatrophihabitans endophyticus]